MPVEVREFELQNGFLHVTVSIPQLPAGRKPAVIRGLGLEERLLERGIIVAHFETHWEKLGPGADEPRAASPSADDPEAKPVGAWLLAAARPGLVGRDYFALIGATAKRTIPRVVDLLASLPEVDPERIAIAGSSTSGFVAFEALLHEPRLVAAVVRVACGDYRRFLRSSSLALDDDPRWLPEGRLVLDADYEPRLLENEPLRHAARFPPRPLLMVNGALDPAIPLSCAESTAEALTRAYAEAGVPERFSFEVFDQAAHDLREGADASILAWWERWLLDAPRSP